MTSRTVKQDDARKRATTVLFLEIVLGFVTRVAKEQGTLLESTPGTNHRTYELLNFGNFSFYADINQNMLGGHEVKIWYHPGLRYEKGLEPVSHVIWQITIDECSLVRFREHSPWKAELLGLAGRRKDISAMKVRARCEENLRQLLRAERAKRLAKV